MIILKNEIEKLIRIHLRETPISVEINYQGGMNYVYTINLLGQILMLKIYPPSRFYIAELEYNMLLLAFDKGIKVPKVIKFGKHKDVGFLFYNKIPGSNLQFEQLTIDQQASFSSELTLNIRKFSELSSSFFGEVTENDYMYDTWNHFLKETIDVGLANLRSANVVNLNKFYNISDFLKHYQNDYSYNGMALGDLKSENIIANQGRFGGIIDLESCFYGDPLITLGYLFAKEGASPFYISMAESFKVFRPFQVEDIYFYTLIRLLRISKYLKNPLPTGKKRDSITNYFLGMNNLINNIF